MARTKQTSHETPQVEGERRREETACAVRLQKREQKKAKLAKKPNKAKESKKKRWISFFFPLWLIWLNFAEIWRPWFFLLWIFAKNMRQKYFLDVLTHPIFLSYCMFSLCFCSNIGDLRLFLHRYRRNLAKLRYYPRCINKPQNRVFVLYKIPKKML